METRTVWQMVWDDYQKWLYKTLRGFGPFSLDKKKNSAIGLSKVVNSILAIISHEQNSKRAVIAMVSGHG